MSDFIFDKNPFPKDPEKIIERKCDYYSNI